MKNNSNNTEEKTENMIEITSETEEKADTEKKPDTKEKAEEKAEAEKSPEKEEKTEQEKLEEKKEKRLEIVIAIFLALTALATAWATWIGSLHGGNQSTNYTKSNNMSAEGNATYNQASQLMMQDMLLWNDISALETEILYYQDSDEDLANLAAYKLYFKCSENLTEGMADMIGWSAEEAIAYAEDPTTYVYSWMNDCEKASVSPFFDENYVNSYFEDAISTLDESQLLLETGMKDNSNGDAFGLVTVIYSVVLFLLGIAGTLKRLPNRMIVVIVGIVGFVIGTVYMFTLPMPTGFDFMSYLG